MGLLKDVNGFNAMPRAGDRDVRAYSTAGSCQVSTPHYE